MRKKRGFVDHRAKPRVEPVPKVNLHPQHSAKLRHEVHPIDSNVAFMVSWRHVVEMMRENEALRPEETVEALVFTDDGVMVHVKTRGR